MIATLPGKIRKMANDRKLAAVLEELRRLVKAHLGVEQFYRDAAVLLASYAKRADQEQSAFRAALNNHDLPAMEKALEAWLPLRAVVDFARVEQWNLNAMRAAGIALGQLIAENPRAKETLLAVCELKLSAAQADAERVTVDETKRLGCEWTPEDVAGSPVVRRVRSKVSHLETIKKRIESEPIQSTWNLAQQLLEDE